MYNVNEQKSFIFIYFQERGPGCTLQYVHGPGHGQERAQRPQRP